MHAPQGSGSPSHRHHHEDEAWYILDGDLTFWLGDERRTASTGDFVFGPRMVEHRFRVDSTEPASSCCSPPPDSRTSPERVDPRRVR